MIRDVKACVMSVGALGTGLEKCLYLCLLYLQCLKEMHASVDELTLDSNVLYMPITYLNEPICQILKLFGVFSQQILFIFHTLSSLTSQYPQIDCNRSRIMFMYLV